MAFVGDGQKLLSEGTKRGIPLAKLREAVNIHTALAGKTGDSFSLAPGAARFGPGGEEVARNPAIDTPTETFTDVDNPYGKGGFGQRSSLTNKISGYQTPSLKGDGAKPFETEQKLRKEYSTVSDVFKKTQDSFRRVVSSADSKSPAGDMALIFNYMKTLDPGSVVRESEFALAASAGSFGEQIKAGALKVMSGERLTTAQRADFMQNATRAYMGQADQQERRRMQFAGIAQNYGLDPGRALVDYLDMDLLKRFGQPQAAPAPTREGNASDRFADVPWQGPPQSAPVQASMMAAQAQGRPAPAAVRRDQFGGGMSPGGRGAGDEFGSPFDASGLAPPAERRQHPFGSMGRAALMGVDLNT